MHYNGRWLPRTLIWKTPCEVPVESGSSKERSARCLMQLCQSGKGMTAMFCPGETAGELRQDPRTTGVSCPGGSGPMRLEEAMRGAWPGNYTHEHLSLDLSNRVPMHFVCQPVSSKLLSVRRQVLLELVNTWDLEGSLAVKRPLHSIISSMSGGVSSRDCWRVNDPSNR